MYLVNPVARNLPESTGLHENDAIRGGRGVCVDTDGAARARVVVGGPLSSPYGPVSTHKDGLAGANPD